MYRNIRIAATGKPQALAIALFDGVKKLPEGLRSVDRDCGGAVDEALARPEFKLSAGSVRTVYAKRGPGRIYVLGLGEKPTAADAEQQPVALTIAAALRTAGAAMVRAADSAKITRLALKVLPGLEGTVPADHAGRAVGEGISIGQFSFNQYRKPDEKNKPMDLAVTPEPATRKAMERALVVGRSMNIARTLAATPPNVAHPGYLVNYCRRLARQVGLRCTIIDAAKARKLGMGGLIAVGAGGSSPPAMICLEYPGRNAGKTTQPILLVGKAVTFDTGGYSLKQTVNMLDMKYDKCGGMAVIGAMHAAATLKVRPRVVGLIPAAENMIDTGAYRPNDIIRFINGVTCEVTNTDAEGRMILADALAYGCARYKPKAVIDLATLTGGVVVALGSFCAGCFCGNAELRSKLFDAADATGERLWHLPLWKDHMAMMKGTHADIVNSGPPGAHPIQGAAFLANFVAKDGDWKKKAPLPWAHLDIAGVSDVKSDCGPFTKGPTGFGVRLLAEYLSAL